MSVFSLPYSHALFYALICCFAFSCISLFPVSLSVLCSLLTSCSVFLQAFLLFPHALSFLTSQSIFIPLPPHSSSLSDATFFLLQHISVSLVILSHSAKSLFPVFIQFCLFTFLFPTSALILSTFNIITFIHWSSHLFPLPVTTGVSDTGMTLCHLFSPGEEILYSRLL